MNPFTFEGVQETLRQYNAAVLGIKTCEGCGATVRPEDASERVVGPPGGVWHQVCLDQAEEFQRDRANP